MNAEIHAISADLQLDISAVGNLLVRSGTLFSNESFHMLNPDSAIATKNNEVECVQSYEGRLRAVQNYDGKTYCYVSTGFDVVLRNNRTASSKFLTVAADAEPAAKSRLVYSKAAGMWFPPGIGLRKPRVALPPLQRVALPRPDVECAGQCNSVKECLFAEIFASTFSDFQGVLMKPPPPLPPAPPSNPPPLEPVVHHPPPSSPPERDWQLHPEKLTCGLKCASFAATVFEGGASSNLVEELGQKGILKNSRCPFECLPAVSELSTASLLKIPDPTGTYFVANQTTTTKIRARICAFQGLWWDVRLRRGCFRQKSATCTNLCERCILTHYGKPSPSLCVMLCRANLTSLESFQIGLQHTTGNILAK